MSQKGLADAVGVNQSTWSRIETGQSSLSVEQLTKAARALGRSPGEILDLAEYTRVDLKKRGIHVEEERPEAPVDNVWVLIGVAALALIVIAVLASASKRKR
jgi:transcriptional regulator with XRE-family HTH domain